MAEVLKKGIRKVIVIGDYECTGKGNQRNGCGALLRIRKKDIYITIAYGRDDEEYCITFKCPECKSETDIPDEDYTGEWHKLPKKNRR